MQRHNKILMSLAIFLCFILVTPSLVRADNIYLQEDFEELGNWRKYPTYEIETQSVELKGDLTRTFLNIRNELPNTICGYYYNPKLTIDNEKLFVDLDVKLNEGERFGVVLLHFYKDDGNPFNVYLYFYKATGTHPHGDMSLSTGSTTLAIVNYIAPNQWHTIKIDIAETLANVNTNNFDQTTFRLDKLEQVFFQAHATSLGTIDVSFDSFVFSKSEYIDLEGFPTIVPDDVEVFKEFEFTTTHFIILLIVGISIFILINKNRRKKVRNYIKKYLKV